MMVIGLYSGKEFFVKNESYSFEDRNGGEIIRAFESEDGKRIITVPTSSIEYYDEASTSKILTILEKASGPTEVIKEDITSLYG